MGGACISIHALGPKDQLLVTTLTGKQTIDGPGIKFLPPLKVGRVRRMDILEPGEYCIVKTTTTGALRRIDGPNQVNLGPYDIILKDLHIFVYKVHTYYSYYIHSPHHIFKGGSLP